MKTRLVAFFRGYGGFLLGIPLVPIFMLWPPDLFDDLYTDLYNIASQLDDSWYSVAFFVFLHNALTTLHVFGCSFLLGGLLSNLRLADGSIITVTLSLGWVLILSLVSGPYQSSESWHFLPALLAFLTATLLSYLFGYSIRRLVYLSWKTRTQHQA